MNIARTIERHQVSVLEFSGGKDSLACLYLLKPWWDKIMVMYANSGDAFPETLAQIDEVEQMVPNFTMVWSNQPRQTEENGYPTDVLPFWDSPLGRQIYSGRKFKMQAPSQCCGENIWIPLDSAVKALGATLVIRGERKEEVRRAPIYNGQVEFGIEYLYPIENWSREDVISFLAKQGVSLPKQYEFYDSSLDCQHCTAFLDRNQGKFKYMEMFHVELNREVKDRIRYIIRAVEGEMAHVRAVVE